jgi:hypothetical protein
LSRFGIAVSALLEAKSPRPSESLEVKMIDLLRISCEIASRLRKEAELSLSASPLMRHRSSIGIQGTQEDITDNSKPGEVDRQVSVPHLIASYQSQLSFLEAELARERKRADQLQQELESSRESERIGDLIITKLSIEKNSSLL